MTARLSIRPLAETDRAAWAPLWQGYLTFYKTSVPQTVTDETWRRFMDPAEPVHAMGCFEGGKLLGIVQYMYHRSTWTIGDRCYLGDLFTVPEARGRGVGRSLIERVYAEARAAGASRVYWQTHETNETAQKLYDSLAEKSGFIIYRKDV